MIETPVVNFLGNVSIEDCAKSKAVVPAGREVCYIDLSVAERLTLTPLEQGVAFRPAALGEDGQGILLVTVSLLI